MSIQFLRDLLERALKTFCQTLVALLGAGAVDLLSVPWLPALSTAGFAALLSVLSSIGSSRLGSERDASLVSAPPG